MNQTRVCVKVCGGGCCQRVRTIPLADGEAGRLTDLAQARGLDLRLAEMPSGAGLAMTPAKPGPGGFGVCTFFDLAERVCTIYADRPISCRQYPVEPHVSGCRLSGWQPGPGRVFVGMPKGPYVTWLPRAHASVRTLLAHLQAKDLLWNADVYESVSVRGDHNRNVLGDHVLRHTDARWLLIIDDDMLFPAEGVEAMVRMDQPILFATYVRKGPPYRPHLYGEASWDHDGHGQPGLFRRTLEPEWAAFLEELDRRHPGKVSDGPMYVAGAPLMPIQAGTTGCLLIRRDVLEEVPYPWFEDSRGMRGDMWFYQKARNCGFEAQTPLGVICAHAKQEPEYVGARSFLDAWRARQPANGQEVAVGAH